DPSHTVDDSGVKQNQDFDMGNNDEQLADKETWISQVVRAKEPNTSVDEIINTPIEFSAFVLNWLNIKDLTQAILVGLAFELLKGTCKSKPYPFDLSKPLPLIPDHRGRQVIPEDFFINSDLEYLKGGDFSKRYSTFGTSHWGPKRQHFYGFAANMSLSKDVYSRKQIIVVTRLTIMKKYDYGHLEDIEDGISSKEEMEWTRQTKGSGYDPEYQKASLLNEANMESGEVRWWKRIQE
nr:hypothetical protein [Tanacetum cinerariifolium]